MWWPWSAGLLATGLFFVSSLHSPSIQNSNAAVGFDVLTPGLNDACATAAGVGVGQQRLAESTFACVKSASGDAAVLGVPADGRGVPLRVVGGELADGHRRVRVGAEPVAAEDLLADRRDLAVASPVVAAAGRG